jgi:hypothetical protein
MGAATSELEREVPSRTLTHWVVAVAVMAVVIAGAYWLATLSSPKPDGCVTKDAYGIQCTRLSGSGLTVSGIEAKYTYGNFVDGHRWTFETTVYSCDPRGVAKRECSPEQTTYGSAQRGNPRHLESLCTIAGDIVPTQDCSGSLNFPLPRTFTSSRWLCTELAIRVHDKWADNAAGYPEGARACREVH